MQLKQLVLDSGVEMGETVLLNVSKSYEIILNSTYFYFSTLSLLRIDKNYTEKRPNEQTDDILTVTVNCAADN